MRFLFIILAMLFLIGQSSIGFSQDKSNRPVLSHDPEWKRLLHYRKSWTGSESSVLSVSSFFLAKNGSQNLEQEWNENLKAFHTKVEYACQFPARALWISKQLGQEARKCAEVEDWKSKIKAESVAIVHVNQFVSNPSSAFGHSFLLFQNSSRPLNMQMAVNNAADIPDDVGAVDYVIKGLFGGFPSSYSLEPLYIKIQEYNNIENRDMWIFDLNLTPEEIDQLLNHIWELIHQGTEPYYFLNRNCSVNIYNAIAAVKPGLDFFPRNRIYVLPVEAVQRMKSIVKRKTYLPSLREKIIQKQKHLAVSKNPGIETAEIQLDLYEYKKSQNGGILSDWDLREYSKLMVQRSQMGPNQDELVLQPPSPPDRATKTSRIAVGWKQQYNQNYNYYALAPMSHSLVQRIDGYLPNSEIVAMEATLLADHHHRYTLDQLAILKLFNLPTSQDFDSQTSFRFQAGFERRDNCFSCHYLMGELAAGKAISLGSKSVAYGLLGLAEEERQVLLPEVVLGVNLHFLNLILNFEHRYLQDLSQTNSSLKQWSGKLGWPFRVHQDLQIKFDQKNGDSSYSALLGYYF